MSSVGRWKPVELEKLAVLELKAAMFDEAMPMLKAYRQRQPEDNHPATCVCRDFYADELARKTHGS